LRLDPVDRGAVAIGALDAITELREPLDRGLVLLEVEARDHGLGVLARFRLRTAAALRERRSGQSGNHTTTGDDRMCCAHEGSPRRRWCAQEDIHLYGRSSYRFDRVDQATVSPCWCESTPRRRRTI